MRSVLLLVALLAGRASAQIVDTNWREPLSRTLRDRTVGLPPQRMRLDSALLQEAWSGIATVSDHSLRLEASGLFDSNSLRNELAIGLWRGERLSREIRQRSDATPNGTGRAGYAVDVTLRYRWGKALFGNAGLRPIIAAGDHDLMGVRFTDDVFRVTFFGNAAYEGRTAELGPSQYLHVRYQTIGLGMEWRATGSYIMLEAVNGQHLTFADVDRSDLFTAIDGRYLRLELDGSYERTAMGPDNGLRSNGTGAAVSVRKIIPLHLPFAEARLLMEAKDMGVVWWHPNSLRVERDTVILYRGIQVSDVLDFDQALVGNASLQDTLGLGYAERSVRTLLPYDLATSLSARGGHSMTYTVAADMRGLPGYLPRGRLSARHVFRARNAVSAEAAYGGFGGLRIGVQLERVLSEGLWLSLGTTNAMGFLSERARGMSACFAVEWHW